MRTVGHDSETRAPRVAERGLSIVEMLVATLLLAIGVAATTMVFASASDATFVAETRSDANRLAETEVERLRALDADRVGFDPATPGFRPRIDGATTVVVAGSTMRPSRTETVESIDFTVATEVTWESVTVAGVTTDEAYKRVRVEVSWTDRLGAHAVERVTALRPELGS